MELQNKLELKGIQTTVGVCHLIKMFGTKLSICFTSLLLVWNAAAFLPIPLTLPLAPCTSPDECKALMGKGFEVQYKTFLTAFLSEALYALQNAATELKAKLAVDDSNYAKLNIIAEAAVHLREILEKKEELDNEKLAYIITEIKAHWATIFELYPDRAQYQTHLDRLAQAFYTAAELVFQAWATASPIGALFKSQLTGYEEIDADVLKAKGLPFSVDNVQLASAILVRIAQFFGVDGRIVYTFP